MPRMPRSLNKNSRLQGLSLPEVVTPWDVEIAAIGWRLGGKKLKPGPAMSALVLAFLSMPEQERREFLWKGFCELENLLNTKKPEGNEPSGPRILDVDVAHVTPKKQSRRSPTTKPRPKRKEG